MVYIVSICLYTVSYLHRVIQRLSTDAISVSCVDSNIPAKKDAPDNGNVLILFSRETGASSEALSCDYGRRLSRRCTY